MTVHALLYRAVRAPSLVEDGVGTFKTALTAYPEFNMFTLVLAQAMEERDSDGFGEAVAAIHASFALCDEMTSKDPACRNGVRVKHNIEGTSLLAGVLLAKDPSQAGHRREEMSLRCCV